MKKKIRFFIFDKIVFPLNRLRSFFGFRMENGIPRIIIHERFELAVKWCIRGIIIIGISSSVFSLPWYYSLVLSLFLFFMERFLEKTVFRKTSLFVAPMPEFDYDSREWDGMGYIYAPDSSAPIFYGPAFKTEQYGIKLFQLLLKWNYNSYEDKECNICTSFVEESNKEYSVYFYANPDRKTEKAFESKMRENAKKEGKESHTLSVGLILCQRFSLSEKSNYYRWKELVAKGAPVALGCFTFNRQSGEVKPIAAIKPIRVFKIKFKRRDELSKKEDFIEFWHRKYFV